MFWFQNCIIDPEMHSTRAGGGRKMVVYAMCSLEEENIFAILNITTSEQVFKQMRGGTQLF